MHCPWVYAKATYPPRIHLEAHFHPFRHRTIPVVHHPGGVAQKHPPNTTIYL